MANNSNSLDDAFALASQHFQSGRLHEAEELYRQILRDHVNHPRALHALGVIAHCSGKGETAAVLIRQAIAAKPDFPDAFNNLGNVFKALGRYDEAVAAYQEALSRKPDFAMAHFNLGHVFKEQGRLDDAIACFKKAVDLRFDYTDALNDLGNALMDRGNRPEAIIYFKKTLAVCPDCAAAHNNLGNALMDQGKLDKAVACFQTAISYKPDYANAFNNLGVAFSRLGRLEEAVSSYTKSIAIYPDNALAHSNLGNAFRDMVRLDEAVKSYTRAITIRPDHHEAYNNLAVVLAEQGMLAEAFDRYRKSLAIKPDYAAAHSNLIFAMNYSPTVTADEIFTESCRWDKVHGGSRVARSMTCCSDRPADRRLRIGYVSPDLREHSVSYFFEPLLANHDREKVEVFCYSDVLKPDKITKRLKRFADRWVNCTGLSDPDLVARIRKDRIDILVDLAGHTAHNRLPTFAEKPAPVQVTWLGYPNTTGLSAIGYRLTDAIADPEGAADGLHTEKLFRLPDSFLCYRPPSRYPKVMAPPSIANGYITFGSFNNLTKVTPQVITLWSAILGLLPASRLILKNKALGDTSTRNRYLQLFHKCGIEGDRVDLLSYEPSTNGHLGLYNRVDIGLDPFPYNGTTTTCEALWMGLPVITLLGDRHAGRVGASMLRNVGLHGLVAETKEEYLHIAMSLAQDRQKLVDLRLKLRKLMAGSPLCNAVGFAKNIEDAYRNIWDIH